MRLARRFLCATLVAFARSAGGQSPPDSIRDIQVDPRPVFDSADARSPFFRILNALHITTRPFVVRQNLTVNPGDHADSASLAESARNLRALGIFRSVAIDTTPVPGGVDLRVTTHDAWTTNPQIHLQTSGSEATVGGGIRETNLLGTNTTLDVEYTKDPDRSTTEISASRPRLIAGLVGADFDFQGRSDGTILDAGLSAPFYRLTTPASGSLSGQIIDARVLQFVGGDRAPAKEVRQKTDALVASGGWALDASDQGYLRAGFTSQIRRDGFRPEFASGPFPRPVTAAVGPYIEYRRIHFYSTRGYQAFGRDEDVDLGLTIRLAAAVAPSPWGYPHGGVGPAATILAGARIPRGFVQANVQADGLVTGAGIDSGTMTAGVTAVWQGGTRQLGIVHAEGGLESHPYPGEEFDLGLGYGARAYQIHAFTGDRMYITGAEYRYIIIPNALGMEAVGISAFIDHAGAWYVGSPIRSGTDGGIGVRFGALRSPTGGMVRIDLAYRAATAFEPAGWVLVVGKGFAFNVR